MIPLALKKHKVYFSKSVAAKLVGGRARLLKLISLGKIAVEKPTVKQNGKWYCSAGDVIRYISLCPPPAATSGRKGIK
ncbi:MAG: hypothetical protein K2M06_01985 [Muribaculaceae bacterium]|nr:hypothetical protein [Muribaculaceae bacterium]